MSRQKKWTSDLRAILAETQNIDSDVKNIVNAIIDHENIPRKKPNFVNNKLGLNWAKLSSSWDLTSL